jgi:hypothetical protein
MDLDLQLENDWNKSKCKTYLSKFHESSNARQQKGAIYVGVQAREFPFSGGLFWLAEERFFVYMVWTGDPRQESGR